MGGSVLSLLASALTRTTCKGGRRIGGSGGGLLALNRRPHPFESDCLHSVEPFSVHVEQPCKILLNDMRA